MIRAVLLAASLLSALAASWCAFLFYVLYWQWRGLFEQGRYYHPPDAVVYQEDAAFFAVPALAFALLALVLLLAARAVVRRGRIAHEAEGQAEQ